MPLVNKFQTILKVTKTSDEIRTSTTTAANDSELLLPLLAGKTYFFTACIFWTTESATPDIKLGIGGASGHSFGEWGISNEVQLDIDSTTGITSAAAEDDGLLIKGLVIMGGSDDDINFIWAQNTSSLDDTIVKAGSWFQAVEIKE